MIRTNLRAAAAALLIGTATVGALTIGLTAPVEAAGGVRAAVGNPLKAAEQAAEAGRYSVAKEKLQEAESVPNKTPAETQAIEQIRNYIDAKSGDANSAVGAKTKFANDYNAKRYSAVIEDAALLRKYGALDADSMQVIAQAYYLSGDSRGCVRYIQNNFGSGGGEGVLSLELECAFQAGDDEIRENVLEQLVARTGKPEYWQQLLTTAERTKGLTDHETLDIYRIKLLTGSIKTADDYSLLAELALQLGFPAEAQNAMQKGFDAKVLSGDRNMRLLNMAKGQAAANAATAAKTTAAANGAKTGDPLIKVGEAQWGMGDYQGAIRSIQAGIQKGVSDQDNAETRLGMAYLGAGQRDAAVRAFAAVKSDPKAKMVAHLWSLYARK